MKVLVTGGAGFIGSHSVEALLRHGADVVVLDDFSNGKRSNLPAPSFVIEGDIRDAATVRKALEGATHVLHLAAQVSVQGSIDDPAHSASHNVAGFLNVLECARQAGVRRFVYASSAAVYGIPAGGALTEESPTAPISPYGLEKLIDDEYAALYKTLYGFATLGLRYFNVYGPRQDPASPYAGVISRWADALGAGKPVRVFGDGLQTRDFVYVEDVARANVAALSGAATGLCNVGTGTSVTLLQLLEALEHAAGRKAERRFEAAVPGDIRESRMNPARLGQALSLRCETPLTEGLRALLKT